MGGSMSDEETEDITFTVRVRVPVRLRPGTIRNLEGALLAYASTMRFVRKAWITTHRGPPPE
jgi:hypothetical protein